MTRYKIDISDADSHAAILAAMTASGVATGRGYHRSGAMTPTQFVCRACEFYAAHLAETRSPTTGLKDEMK